MHVYSLWKTGNIKENQAGCQKLKMNYCEENSQSFIRIEIWGFGLFFFFFCVFEEKFQRGFCSGVWLHVGQRILLNQGKELVTLPFGKDLMGCLFLTAEQQSEWTWGSYIDLLSYKCSLHKVMNSASVVVLYLGLKGEDETSINTCI